MLSNKLASVNALLGELGGEIPEAAWEKVQACREALTALHGQAAELEKSFVPQAQAEGGEDD